MKLPDLDVQTLRLRPGDALAVFTPDMISSLHAERIGVLVREFLTKAGHPDLPIMLLDGGKSLAVVRPGPDVTATAKAALLKALETFDHYRDLHRAKGTPDGDEKADRNACLAAIMDKALATMRDAEVEDRLSGLAPEVVALVIAAREVMDAGPQAGAEEIDPLDKALEAFASRVPYADEPEA